MKNLRTQPPLSHLSTPFHRDQSKPLPFFSFARHSHSHSHSQSSSLLRLQRTKSEFFSQLSPSPARLRLRNEEDGRGTADSPTRERLRGPPTSSSLRQVGVQDLVLLQRPHLGVHRHSPIPLRRRLHRRRPEESDRA